MENKFVLGIFAFGIFALEKLALGMMISWVEGSDFVAGCD